MVMHTRARLCDDELMLYLLAGFTHMLYRLYWFFALPLSRFPLTSPRKNDFGEVVRIQTGNRNIDFEAIRLHNGEICERSDLRLLSLTVCTYESERN